MTRNRLMPPLFDRWGLLVVVLALGWALLRAYRVPARLDDLLLHLFVILSVIAAYTLVWVLVRIIVGVVRHRRRERRM